MATSKHNTVNTSSNCTCKRSTVKSQQRKGTAVTPAAKTARGSKQRWQSDVKNVSNKSIHNSVKIKSDYRTNRSK
jgi:hypothetical protein